jgi:hypothetical protein
MMSVSESTQGNTGEGINIFGDNSIGYWWEKSFHMNMCSFWLSQKGLLDSPEQIKLHFLQNKGS